MSAETLRRAANLMRERADAVTTWTRRHPEDSGGTLAWFTPVFIAEAFGKEAFGPADDPVLREGWKLDGEHFAPWHPDVARAVADWLEAAADGDGNLPHRYPADAPDEVISWACQACGEVIHEMYGVRTTCSVDWRPRDPHALTVARAYLGESA